MDWTTKGRVLLTAVAALTTVGGFLADWNRTHLFNPDWSGVNCTLVFTSTKAPSFWFYILLRKATKAPIAMPATAPRFTVGCNSSQL
jgi:hypothetical protein